MSLANIEPAGMKAGRFFRLTDADLIELPQGSEIFKLPNRVSIAFDPVKLKFIEDRRCLAIAAFLPPGYTVTYSSAYKEIGKPACSGGYSLQSGRPKMLPLFSYAACSAYEGKIYAAAVRVDRSLCHDSRFMDMDTVKKNAVFLKKLFTKNRLIPHLEKCALLYNCPNAKNFFLKRYEGPLPASPECNAQCAGCISYQPHKTCPVTQPRIKFIPTPEEIAEVALLHINAVKKAVVSFGQGCEGEPLLSSETIEKAVRLIRNKTSKGVINMNTNGSRPDSIARLFDLGLDSIRVSLNSVREVYYSRYYEPRGYSFNDVIKSIDTAKKRKKFVSINYLTMPGFTDSRDEFTALKKFLLKHRIDMIQWRNLNYDPLRYFDVLKISIEPKNMLGIKEIIFSLKKEFGGIKMGYFNSYEGVVNRRI